jgi:hypothetical protein
MAPDQSAVHDFPWGEHPLYSPLVVGSCAKPAVACATLEGGRLQQIAVHVYRAVGAGVAIALMEVLARAAEEPLSRVPFVTSIVLVMALPESEGARSYNVVGRAHAELRRGAGGVLDAGLG